MATDKSKSRVRPSRNRTNPTPPSAPADSDSHVTHVAAATFEDAIETERARLMTAEAILHCVVIAMDEDDGDNAHAPHYQSAVDGAREFVTLSIDRLDSVRVGLMIGNTEVCRKDGVKEAAVEYVH
jgi:hypothetical protein